MWNTLAKFFPWRRLIVVSVVLPLIGVLAVLAFAWPAARIGPRELPVGVAGASPAAQQAVAGLTRSQPAGFSIRRYAGQAPARSAIEHRDIYGAFVISPGRITVLEASAASPAVAELLSAAGQQLASHPATHAAATAQPRPAIQVKTIDVVATSASDPRGLVLGAAPLPLTIVGVLMAAAIMLVARFRPAWRQLVALAVVCAVAGLGLPDRPGLPRRAARRTRSHLGFPIPHPARRQRPHRRADRPHRPGRPCRGRRPHDHRRQRVLCGHLRTAVAARRGRPHRAVAPRRSRRQPAPQHRLLQRQRRGPAPATSSCSTTRSTSAGGTSASPATPTQASSTGTDDELQHRVAASQWTPRYESPVRRG
jgi:hypothetical protein